MEIKSKYYVCNSIEDIQILHPVKGKIYHRLTHRPVMVKGMWKHTPEQLEKLLTRPVWTIAELRELEGR